MLRYGQQEERRVSDWKPRWMTGFEIADREVKLLVLDLGDSGERTGLAGTVSSIWLQLNLRCLCPSGAVKPGLRWRSGSGRDGGGQGGIRVT
jgi:hypothetical protein